MMKEPFQRFFVSGKSFRLKNQIWIIFKKCDRRENKQKHVKKITTKFLTQNLKKEKDVTV
jgi:hypothetical protein